MRGLALTPFERCLAAYVASTIHEDPSRSSALAEQLYELDGAGAAWTVFDNHRIDVIVAYMTKLSRRPGRIDARDIRRLRAVGFTEFDIFDLDNVAAHYDVAPVANGSRPRQRLAPALS